MSTGNHQLPRSKDTEKMMYTTLLMVTLVGITTPEEIFGPTEYCNRDDFNATCQAGEVVLMVSAQYGRMAIGRCVKQNLGYVGCAVDALGILDARCSGKRSCILPVDDDALYDIRACPDDITNYLLASYKCVPVATDTERSCITNGFVSVRETSGYLATSVSEISGSGTELCPWVVTVETGRRVNLTLYNFIHSGVVIDLPMDSSVCYELGTIREEGHASKKILTCGSDSREKNIYISNTNSVQISFVDRSILGTLGNFLVQYQASGCTEPVTPAGAFVQRNGATAIFICNDSDQSWTLTCTEGQWQGRAGNCSTGTNWDSPGFFSATGGFPYGILIIVSIGVALGVFVGGVLLSCVIFYVKSRRQEHDEPHQEMDSVHQDTLRAAKVWVDEQDARAQWSTYGSSTMRSQYRDQDPRTAFAREKFADSHHYDPSTTTPRHGSTEYDPRHHIYECPQFS